MHPICLTYTARRRQPNQSNAHHSATTSPPLSLLSIVATCSCLERLQPLRLQQFLAIAFRTNNALANIKATAMPSLLVPSRLDMISAANSGAHDIELVLLLEARWGVLSLEADCQVTVVISTRSLDLRGTVVVLLVLLVFVVSLLAFDMLASTSRDIANSNSSNRIGQICEGRDACAIGESWLGDFETLLYRIVSTK